jgi:hypothetical protein
MTLSLDLIQRLVAMALPKSVVFLSLSRSLFLALFSLSVSLSLSISLFSRFGLPLFLFAAINSTPEPLANIDPLRLRPLPLILQRTPRAKRREIKMEIQVGVVAQVNILTWLFHIFLKKIIVKIIHIKGRNFTEVIVTIAAG